MYRGPKEGASNNLLASPDPKTLVLGTLPDAEFVQTLDKKNQLPGDLQGHINGVSHATIWGVVNLKNQAIQQGMQQIPAQQAGAVPGGAQIVEAIKRGKFVIYAAELSGAAKLQLGLVCDKDADATTLETNLNTLWNDVGKKFLGAVPLFLGNQPGMEGISMAVNDLDRTLKISRRGAGVFVAVEFSEKTLKALENVKDMPFPGGMGGF